MFEPGSKMQGPLFAEFLRDVSDLRVCSPLLETYPDARLVTFIKDGEEYAGSFNVAKNVGYVITRAELSKMGTLTDCLHPTRGYGNDRADHLAE